MAILVANFRNGNKMKSHNGGFATERVNQKHERKPLNNCYNCGRYIHFATDCRVKTSASTLERQPVTRINKYDKYKSKYKKLKAHVKSNKKKSKGLITEEATLSDSDSPSSSDEEDEALMCLDKAFVSWLMMMHFKRIF